MTELQKAAELTLEILERIVNSNWRNWEELASPEQFELWAKRRANHCGVVLRQALDHVPDTTKMIEPDMGIDRGAWSDVPDASKWLDELRGDETEHQPEAWPHKWGCRANAFGKCDKGCTAPPTREWVGLTEEDREILEAVRRELDRGNQDGNAPGHGHEVPGIWDSDNGARAGKPCAWCLTWKKFTTLIDRESTQKDKKK